MFFGFSGIDIFEEYKSLVVQNVLNLDVCFLLFRFRLNIVWQECYTSVVVSLMYHSGRYVMLLCSIIGDTKFDHLVKELSARFLHCKGTFPSL